MFKPHYCNVSLNSPSNNSCPLMMLMFSLFCCSCFVCRAVSDAAAGEYSSATETLETAISLIKQSKVAQDERCKILIVSLQDTLHGIEAKSYTRRERSRSRERSHRRQRRERSTSRYRERSRDRERERERDRDRDRERDG